jgi:NADH:ubiquinone reductase (H+-translocating)
MVANERVGSSAPGRPRVVIVGAGFAGLNAARALRRAPVEVLLVDQNNYHTFQPLLYQVATSGLEMGDIAHQVRGVFHGQTNFRFRQGIVTGVDWDAKALELKDGGRLPFDYLILGAGAVYFDFGVPGVQEYGFFLKSLTEAANIRSHVLTQFERASAQPELIEAGALSFVIVGGGPTGVEMAGALAELFNGPLKKDFPELEHARVRLILVEATGDLLPPFSPRTRRYTARVLERLGVEVRLNEAVTEVAASRVTLKSGEVIPAGTLIWAAGVRAHPLAEALGLPLGRGFRVVQEPDLSLPGKPYAFVAGDMAGVTDGAGRPYPQVAQVAIQQGKHAARQILRRVRGEPSEPFRYRDLGVMAIIGRNAGVAELSRGLGGFKLRGFLGWLGWLFIHLVYLPGHQNRIVALANWAYNYLTFDRHVRLITFLRHRPSDASAEAAALTSPAQAKGSRAKDGELVR